jgi:hypothetical protein
MILRLLPQLGGTFTLQGYIPLGTGCSPEYERENVVLCMLLIRTIFPDSDPTYSGHKNRQKFSQFQNFCF